MARAYATSRTKVVACYVCGDDITVNYYVRTAKRCSRHGEMLAADAIRQMREKSGPVYERYRAAMALAALRNRWGTPSPS